MNIKSVLKRIVKAVIIFEVGYLVLVNLALSLPLTQTLVNQIKPEKFSVHWDKAWTWYPFRVHAEGISVNGQSGSQQWQVDLPAASASIAILPLIFRTVKIQDVAGESVSYFQRPRLKPDNDYAAVREYFPPIMGREINQASQATKKKRKPWDIQLHDIHATGSHNFWMYQLKGSAEGDLQADLNIQTQGGPFSVSNAKIDLKVDSLTINGNHEVLRQAAIKGDVAILPVVFKQNKGIKILPYLDVDAEIDGDVGSLAFLNLYLENFQGMKVDGVGKVNGRLRLDQGKLLQGTDLAISARELSLYLMSHKAEGGGSINMDVSAEEPETLNLAIQFDALKAFHESDPRPLFSGEGLAIAGSGKTALPILQDQEPGMSRLSVTVPIVQVPDLAVYQRYLPEKWQFQVHGGVGELHARAELLKTSFNAELNLTSEHADVGVKDYRFQSDLDLGFNIDNPSFASALVDISGTYIRLGDSRLANEEKGQSELVQTELVIKKGELELQLPELANEDADLKQLSQVLKNYDLNTLLSVANAELEIDGTMSDLSWITILLKNTHDLAIGGTGKVKIHALVDSGWPSEGTLAEILPEELVLKVLDYEVQGDGLIRMAVVKGGENPSVKLDMDITDGLLKRKDEDQAFIEQVVIKLDALGENLGSGRPVDELELHLQIPSAQVTDMSVFNHYFPDKSPMQLLSGKADLTADINLGKEIAGGFVKLNTQDLKGSLDDQQISADLAVDIKLADGVPKDLDFDISGSTILLDQVKVAGAQTSFDQSDWNIRFDLKKGRAIWKKPIQVQMEADVQMKDTRPIVAMLANHREKHGWLEKLLTIEDIQGEAVMNMEQKQIVIPYAFISSDKVDVGAKGVITETTRDGMFYARFKKLKGLLKIKDGKRNFDILNAKKKFDEYSPGTGKITP